MAVALEPTQLRQLGAKTFGVVWKDGHNSIYQVRNLRLACRCANCIDEWTREKILKEETIPQDIKPKNIQSVGRYALKIDWSDGHNTGIYTFEQLRSQCECPACKK